MTDDERAQIGAEHRRRTSAPVLGVPIAVESEETPVHELAAMIPEDPAAAARFVLAKALARTRNVQAWTLEELRKLGPAQQAEAVAELRGELEDHRVAWVKADADIRGEKGDNGKLGALKARLDTISSRAWWLVTTLVGGVGYAVVKLVTVTTLFNQVAERSLHNAQRVQALESQIQTLTGALLAREAAHQFAPAVTPEKDTQ